MKRRTLLMALLTIFVISACGCGPRGVQPEKTDSLAECPGYTAEEAYCWT